MNRLLALLTFCMALFVVEAVRAQCCGPVLTTTYYAPAPVATVQYALAPVTTYYAPTTTAYYAPAPTTVYYAAPTTVYYQRPLVGTGITRVGYAPVTYVTPRATYYAPVTYATVYRAWW
jgi:hypothetical protein